MVRRKAKTFLLIILFEFITRHGFAYAWLQDKNGKYQEISFRSNIEYESYFQDTETTNCQKFNFTDKTKTYGLSNYSEKGINRKITWISKINLNYYISELTIATIANSPIELSTYWTNEGSRNIALTRQLQTYYFDCVENKQITIKKKFFILESEFGLRALLIKTKNQSVAIETTLIPPNSISILNGTTKPSLRVNLAVGGETPMLKSNKNFYEFMVGSQFNSLEKKISFFSQINFGLQVFNNNFFIMGYEKTILGNVNAERLVYQNEYKKILQKYYHDYQEYLTKTVDKYVLPKGKANNNKIFFKFIIPANNQNSFAISAYSEWKSKAHGIIKKPYNYLQFSFIRKIN